jgi:valyl-tRNA synthetase
MSKSLGNSPDPLELISEYGADAVRTGMLFSSPAGNDLLFDMKLVEQGRNFANKIWNAFRLFTTWRPSNTAKQSIAQKEAILWFEARLQKSIGEVERLLSDYRMADALMELYKMSWEDFCSWYLEAVKPQTEEVDAATYEKTQSFFDSIFRLLHPFMPFITEELWQLLKEREQDELLCLSEWPSAHQYDESIILQFEHTREVVSSVRAARSKAGISPKEALPLSLSGPAVCMEGLLSKLANLSAYEQVQSAVDGATSFRVNKTEYFLVLGGHVDQAEERDKLEKELNYLKGFLRSVEGKLKNERFVSGAPEAVVEKERAKKADA